QLVGEAHRDQARTGVVMFAKEGPELSLLLVGQRAPEAIGPEEDGDGQQGEDGNPEHASSAMGALPLSPGIRAQKKPGGAAFRANFAWKGRPPATPSTSTRRQGRAWSKGSPPARRMSKTRSAA